MQLSPIKKSLLICLVYFLISAFWLLAGDWLLDAAIANAPLLTLTKALKGFGFVLISSLFLYLLLRQVFVSNGQPAHGPRPYDEDYLDILQMLHEGVWMTNAEGLITFANDTFCKMLGYSSSTGLINRPVQELISQESQSDYPKYEDVHSSIRVELGFLRSDGETTALSATISGLRRQGRPDRLVGMTSGFTESELAREALRVSEARYRYLFESSPVSLWEEDFSAIKKLANRLKEQKITNLDAYFADHPEELEACIKSIRVIDINPFTVELFGVKNKEELLGNLGHIIGSGGRDIFKQEVAAVFSGKNSFASYGVNYRPDGKLINVLLRWSIVPGYEDTLERVVVFLMDVTEQESAKEAIRAAEARYRLLVEQVNAVMYIDQVDEVSSALYTSPQIEAVTGYTSEEWIKDPHFWPKVIHPEDRARVLKENARTNRTGEMFSMEYRLLHKSGRIVWVRDEAVMVRDPHTGANVWQGVIIDITARKQAEEALQRSEARFRLLLESQGEGTLLFNLAGVVDFANPAAEELFGVPTGTLVGVKLSEFAALGEIERLMGRLPELPAGRSTTVEINIVRPVDLGQRCVLATLTPWIDGKGALAGGLALCSDITEKKADELRLRYDSTHDALTDVFNRRYFEDELERFGEGCTYPISMVVSDLDGLKHTNDLLGHLAGDNLLRRAAQALRDVFRSTDVIARIGGDEFAVLLPGMDQDGTRRVVDRLRLHLVELNRLQPEPSLSISVGFATAMDADALEQIFHRADLAMYEEKIEKRRTGSNLSSTAEIKP